MIIRIPCLWDQTGIFSSPAEGAALSALCSSKGGPEMLRAAKSHLVVEAALFDFVFCAGDRHTQTCTWTRTGRFAPIDNDKSARATGAGQEERETLRGVQPVHPGEHGELAFASVQVLRKPARGRWTPVPRGALGRGEAQAAARDVPAAFRRRRPGGAPERVRHTGDCVRENASKTIGGSPSLGFPRRLSARGSESGTRPRAPSLERPTNKTWDRLEESEKSKVQAWRDSMWRPTNRPCATDRCPTGKARRSTTEPTRPSQGGVRGQTGAQVGNYAPTRLSASRRRHRRTVRVSTTRGAHGRRENSLRIVYEQCG